MAQRSEVWLRAWHEAHEAHAPASWCAVYADAAQAYADAGRAVAAAHDLERGIQADLEEAAAAGDADAVADFRKALVAAGRFALEAREAWRGALADWQKLATRLGIL